MALKPGSIDLLAGFHVDRPSAWAETFHPPKTSPSSKPNVDGPNYGLGVRLSDETGQVRVVAMKPG